MMNQSIRNKIKKIKVHTKRIMQSTLSGDYISAFKGSGLEFDQIREYQVGDDIRSIDWNNSAKINKIMVKQFIEERERTIILVIDVSASNNYGSGAELRQETIAQLAATLAFIATENKDNVGALFFSDVIEQWIAPSKGNLHIGRIIETIFTIQPKNTGTNVAAALRFLASTKKRNAVVFMISDWIDPDSEYQNLLKIVRCKYDFVAMRISDPCEQQIPDIGLLDVQDPESGELVTLDTRGSNNLARTLRNRQAEQKRMFEKYKIDLLDLVVAEPLINPLIKFFHLRTRRQI